jgi:cytochrome c2
MRAWLLAVLIVPVLCGIAEAAEKADARAGENAYRLQCASCHSLEAGKNGLGPSLAGVFGQKAGSVVGYSYSNALKASGLVLDKVGLDKYLAAPGATVPGTKMFINVQDAKTRADIIAYLAAH